MRWADRLVAARRRGFVGRAAELARFGELLADPDEPRVVYVYGPGGVGKTALLHQFGWLAGQAGRRCVWLDGREVQPDAETVTGLLGSLEDDLVLLVDGAEGLDRLLREEVLPRLAAGAVVVLAGRGRPPAQWRADPGWRELVEVMPLGNLAEAEDAEPASASAATTPAPPAASAIPIRFPDIITALLTGHCPFLLGTPER